jgi:phosphoglycerate dehydrogenase-like enzyme
MSFVLSFARGLHIYARQQRDAQWQPHGASSVVYLPGATALIVGVGNIGAETARLCAAFGMRVVGVDARRTDVPEGVEALHPPEALDALLPEADFVILTIPHTPKTEGLFDADRFGRMKRTAYFVNIGRGMTTKLDALDAALRSGTIAGAGLDVYEVEPLPKDHPLWTAPNAISPPTSPTGARPRSRSGSPSSPRTPGASPPESPSSTSSTRPTGSDRLCAPEPPPPMPSSG